MRKFEVECLPTVNPIRNQLNGEIFPFTRKLETLSLFRTVLGEQREYLLHLLYEMLISH